jgi:hypothetical protein
MTFHATGVRELRGLSRSWWISMSAVTKATGCISAAVGPIQEWVGVLTPPNKRKTTTRMAITEKSGSKAAD